MKSNRILNFLSKNLIKISFAISLLGILFLLFLNNTLTPELTNISNITEKQLNKKIQIQGLITAIKTPTPDFQILTISDSTGQIDITLNPKNNPLNITQNQNLTIFGKITEYKGNLQIQAEKIILNP